VKVLDRGFVELVDTMGDDLAIVRATRVSYGKAESKDPRGLIRYLMRREHTSPFEMCEIKLHLKMPIFVARQWVRHRTANVNEISGRYVELPEEFYLPVPQDCHYQSDNNKQGRSGRLPYDEAQTLIDVMRDTNENGFDTYHCVVNDGVAKELARTVLPLSTYTEFVWKIDLHNLLHFLKLRLDSHAQLEIRRYAEVISEIVRQWVPITWEAFEDYRLHAVTFSREETKVLGWMLNLDDIPAKELIRRTAVETGLSERETNEFMEKLNAIR